MDQLFTILEKHQDAALWITFFLLFIFSDVFKKKEKISLRDYYAARAPEVPKWFQIVIEPVPLRPNLLNEIFGLYSGHKDKEIFLKHYFEEGEKWIMASRSVAGEFVDIPADDFSIVPESLKKEVEAQTLKIEKYLDLKSKWEHKKNKETVKQWRYYYADLMTGKI